MDFFKKAKKVEGRLFRRTCIIGSIINLFPLAFFSNGLVLPIWSIVTLPFVLFATWFIEFFLLALFGIAKRGFSPNLLKKRPDNSMETIFFHIPDFEDYYHREEVRNWYIDKYFKKEPVYARKITNIHKRHYVFAIVALIISIVLFIILFVKKITYDPSHLTESSNKTFITVYVWMYVAYSEAMVASAIMFLLTKHRKAYYKTLLCEKCGAMGSLIYLSSNGDSYHCECPYCNHYQVLNDKH